MTGYSKFAFVKGDGIIENWPAGVNECYGDGVPTTPDDGLMILAIASSNTQMPDVTSSNFKLFGVDGPPSGISVATSTAVL